MGQKLCNVLKMSLGFIWGLLYGLLYALSTKYLDFVGDVVHYSIDSVRSVRYEWRCFVHSCNVTVCRTVSIECMNLSYCYKFFDRSFVFCFVKFSRNDFYNAFKKLFNAK